MVPNNQRAPFKTLHGLSVESDHNASEHRKVGDVTPIPKIPKVPQLFVKIVNRENRSTNISKAQLFLRRELAALVTGTYERPIEIRMLDAAEIKAIQVSWAKSRLWGAVKGSFEWFVGDCGGSTLVKFYSGRGTKPGTSGGTRVLKAQRGLDQKRKPGE